jgi:hypothetical protein
MAIGGTTMRSNKIIRFSLAAVSLAFFLATQPAARASVNVDIQPPSQTVLAGSNPALTAVVTTSAGETITGYSWLKSTNTQGPFVAISGANSATLTITNAQPRDAGYYFASLTYDSGAVHGATAVSTLATLAVVDQARVTTQPQSLILPAGSNAFFMITASGSPPLNYQWRQNGTNLADGARITGSTTPGLSIAGLVAADAGNYDVVVANSFSSTTSHVATLTVLLPPSITIPPTNLAIISGSNAVFSVAADGSAPLSFQWQENGVNMTNNGRITGATSDTLTIFNASTNDNGSYSVFISNVVGSTNSAAATLTVLVPPVITSATNAAGKQGTFLTFLLTATGTPPITFGAQGLPVGLGLDPVSGVISGVPAVFGVFNVTLFATNAALTATGQLVITLASDVPGIASALSVSGMQGQAFNYAILASNGPVVFSATGLSPGVNLNPNTGLISGFPLVSGSFPATISVANLYGGESQILTLNIASAAPIITSPLTATGTEDQAGFAYTIQAANSPLSFGAAGLPLGLNINTNTGAITGTPLYGGVFDVPISAANAWGTTTNTLQLNLNFDPVSTLFITDVSYNYSSPYLLNFAFSLRTDTNVSTAHAVVRPPSQLQVVCLEDGRPIGDETSVIVQSGSRKQLKTFLVLDYTFSMFDVPGLIDTMQTDANALISALPADAQFGIYEFHSDSVDPQIVANLTPDKAALGRDIGGILTNYVQNNFAGSRVWDALYDALGQFGLPSDAEQHYVVLMSDGNDDSSLLSPTNGTVLDALVNMAQTNAVRIFCVGYGNNVNAGALQQLAFQTGGRFFDAGNAPALDTEFARIAKDADGQYLLQWATLKRSPTAFQPAFEVTVDGITAGFNTAMGFLTNIVVITNPPPPMTNFVLTNITLVPLYSPSNYSGDVTAGVLHLAADPYTGPQIIRLVADYVPRYVRAIRVNYRPNFPCVTSLSSTGPGEILNGWSLTETNDGSGGRWLTLASSNPTNLLTSIPYGAAGDLVTFQFQFPEKLTAQKAFSAFTVDDNVYGTMPPGGQSFQILNVNQFITSYPLPPPHGTPIPWLVSYGFTNNFAAAELSDPNGNGFAVWQDYLAGLNPRDPNSKFVIQPFSEPQPGQPPQITFSTVVGRTYRVESSTTLVGWTILQDYIVGTGGNVSVTDDRNLSTVSSVFYRVVVY